MDSNGTDYYEYRPLTSYQAANAFNGSWSNLGDGDAWWSLDHSNTVDVIVDDNTTLHGHWVQIDIGTEIILTKFIVRASYEWAEHWHMRKAKFLTSLTGEDGSWTEIYNIDVGINHFQSADKTFYINNSDQIPGRFYRMVVTEVGPAPGANTDFGFAYQEFSSHGFVKISELSLFGRIPTAFHDDRGTPNKLVVTGNAAGDDFNITSNFALNDIATVLPSESITQGESERYSEEEILTLMKTELEKSDKVNTAVLENNEITLTGNASGDDFTITSTMDTDIEILTNSLTEEDILTLMKTELQKSDKISTAVLENNELTFRGNAVGDDFIITSTLDLNPIELLPPVETEEDILTLIKNELGKSLKISDVVIDNNVLKIKGNDEGDDFIVTSTLNINNTKISSTLSQSDFYNLIKNILEDDEKIASNYIGNVEIVNESLIITAKYNNGLIRPIKISSNVISDDAETHILQQIDYPYQPEEIVPQIYQKLLELNTSGQTSLLSVELSSDNKSIITKRNFDGGSQVLISIENYNQEDIGNVNIEMIPYPNFKNDKLQEIIQLINNYSSPLGYTLTYNEEDTTIRVDGSKQGDTIILQLPSPLLSFTITNNYTEGEILTLIQNAFEDPLQNYYDFSTIENINGSIKLSTAAESTAPFILSSDSSFITIENVGDLSDVVLQNYLSDIKTKLENNFGWNIIHKSTKLLITKSGNGQGNNDDDPLIIRSDVPFLKTYENILDTYYLLNQLKEAVLSIGSDKINNVIIDFDNEILTIYPITNQHYSFSLKDSNDQLSSIISVTKEYHSEEFLTLIKDLLVGNGINSESIQVSNNTLTINTITDQQHNDYKDISHNYGRLHNLDIQEFDSNGNNTNKINRINHEIITDSIIDTRPEKVIYHLIDELKGSDDIYNIDYNPVNNEITIIGNNLGDVVDIIHFEGLNFKQSQDAPDIFEYLDVKNHFIDELSNLFDTTIISNNLAIESIIRKGNKFTFNTGVVIASLEIKKKTGVSPDTYETETGIEINIGNTKLLKDVLNESITNMSNNLMNNFTINKSWKYDITDESYRKRKFKITSQDSFDINADNVRFLLTGKAVEDYNEYDYALLAFSDESTNRFTITTQESFNISSEIQPYTHCRYSTGNVLFNDTSIFFPGSDYLNIPKEVLTEVNNSFTIECWWISYEEEEFVALWSLISSNEDELLIMRPDGLEAEGGNIILPADDDNAENPFEEDDKWHHTAFVYDHTTDRTVWYVDGKANQSWNRNLCSLSNLTHCIIGGHDDDETYFHGYMDRFRISNTARYKGVCPHKWSNYLEDGVTKWLRPISSVFSIKIPDTIKSNEIDLLYTFLKNALEETDNINEVSDLGFSSNKVATEEIEFTLQGEGYNYYPQIDFTNWDASANPVILNKKPTGSEVFNMIKTELNKIVGDKVSSVTEVSNSDGNRKLSIKGLSNGSEIILRFGNTGDLNPSVFPFYSATVKQEPYNLVHQKEDLLDKLKLTFKNIADNDQVNINSDSVTIETVPLVGITQNKALIINGKDISQNDIYSAYVNQVVHTNAPTYEKENVNIINNILKKIPMGRNELLYQNITFNSPNENIGDVFIVTNSFSGGSDNVLFDIYEGVDRTQTGWPTGIDSRDRSPTCSEIEEFNDGRINYIWTNHYLMNEINEAIELKGDDIAFSNKVFQTSENTDTVDFNISLPSIRLTGNNDGTSINDLNVKLHYTLNDAAQENVIVLNKITTAGIIQEENSVFFAKIKDELEKSPRIHEVTRDGNVWTMIGLNDGSSIGELIFSRDSLAVSNLSISNSTEPFTINQISSPAQPSRSASEILNDMFNQINSHETINSFKYAGTVTTDEYIIYNMYRDDDANNIIDPLSSTIGTLSVEASGGGDSSEFIINDNRQTIYEPLQDKLAFMNIFEVGDASANIFNNINLSYSDNKGKKFAIITGNNDGSDMGDIKYSYPSLEMEIRYVDGEDNTNIRTNIVDYIPYLKQDFDKTQMESHIIDADWDNCAVIAYLDLLIETSQSVKEKVGIAILNGGGPQLSEGGTSELYNMINLNSNNLNNVDLPFTMANIIVNEYPKYGGNYELRINPFNQSTNQLTGEIVIGDTIRYT